MDFHKLRTRFRQFGGMRLVWQYAKLGTLWPAVKAGVKCCFKFHIPGFKFLDALLFVFQYTNEGSVSVSISNWFITACRNNEVLMVLREMLYAYWRDYDCVLFHKMSQRVSGAVKQDKNNYYNAIIRMYGEKQIPNR